jgi:hypothetical protein
MEVRDSKIVTCASFSLLVVCGHPGLSTRCDFIRLITASKAKRRVEFAMDSPAALLQLIQCSRFNSFVQIFPV